MRKLHNVEQKSPEWYALKEQYPLTASEAQAIGNNSKGLDTLCLKKMAEKYSSADKIQYRNSDMDRGNELEDQARELYMLETGAVVEKIGFVTDDEISKVGGASPDGDVVGTDGILEIKAFEDAKHFQMILDLKKTGKFEVESKYVWQMQQQLLFMGKKWNDFCAFNPNYPQSLLIQRVNADPEMQAKIREGLAKGEKIINEIEENLK